MAHITESTLFNQLKRITPGFHWQRHEDKLTKGIPDCSYGACNIGGWVELKTYGNWPAEADSPLVWSDLKPEQVNWCIARGRTQRSVFFLLVVGEDYLLISWRHARKFGKLNKAQLIEVAEAHSCGRMNQDFTKVLRRRYANSST